MVRWTGAFGGAAQHLACASLIAAQPRQTYPIGDCAMDWTTPTFDDVKMDSEIGSYQEDTGPYDRSFSPEERAGAPVRSVAGSLARSRPERAVGDAPGQCHQFWGLACFCPPAMFPPT
jgi:hypothetical protein